MWGELLRVHHYPSNHHLCISLSFCFQRKYSRCNLVVTFFRGLTWFFFSPITSSLSFLKTLFSAFSHTLLVRFIPLPPLQTAFYSLSLNSLRGIPQDNSSPVFSQFLYSAPSSSRFTLLLAEYVLLLRGWENLSTTTNSRTIFIVDSPVFSFLVALTFCWSLHFRNLFSALQRNAQRVPIKFLLYTSSILEELNFSVQKRLPDKEEWFL